MFVVNALNYLNSHAPGLINRINVAGHKVVDYGCAEGDGTAFLDGSLRCRVEGRDISGAAVERAQARWPLIKFAKEDIRNPAGFAHTIWTSHTIEHLVDPAAVISRLREHCSLLVVIVPVVRDVPTEGPHVDAVPTHIWTRQVEAPLIYGTFETLRYDIETPYDGRDYYCGEESLICVWEQP